MGRSGRYFIAARVFVTDFQLSAKKKRKKEKKKKRKMTRCKLTCFAFLNIVRQPNSEKIFSANSDVEFELFCKS